MRLIIVRHGETPYNLEGRYTGQSDVSLTAVGKRQAELVGAFLAQEHLDVIVSSDLQRSRLTAQAIARHHALPVLEDADLREMSLGMWEGSLFTEVAVREPEALAHWRTDPSAYAPPGGENLVQLRTRAVRTLKRWQTRYPEATVVWATHGGFIGVVVCHLLDIDLNRRAQFRFSNASISEVILQRNGPIFMRLNETGHLGAEARYEE